MGSADGEGHEDDEGVWNAQKFKKREIFKMSFCGRFSNLILLFSG